MFPNNLQLRTRVDGEAVQDSSTSNMIFSKHREAAKKRYFLSSPATKAFSPPPRA